LIIDLAALEWMNPPGKRAVGCDGLELHTLARTDFWQRTHYGFRRDDGHFAFVRRKGDFTAEVAVAVEPNAKYDQAGLMVRFSPSCWLKTSCEYQPSGPSQLGAVATNAGWSDWSYRPVAPYPASVRLRVERHGGDYLVSAAVGDEAMTVHRVAHLLEDDGGEALVGLYACSPDGAGALVRFTDFSITPRA
jgi:regulation of enolase protein 1 (concanavalin A-like superfamily)